MSTGRYKFLRNAGLMNTDAHTMRELSGADEQGQLVSFCHSNKCAPNHPSRKGKPVFIGNAERCPKCNAKIIYQDVCSNAAVGRFRLKYPGL